MQVLLLKDVRKLGHVGDVVDVKPGYARNYLYPEGLCTIPSDENLAAIEEEKQRAAAERAKQNDEFVKLAARLEDAGVTIEASANPEGTLYGSVGTKEIADALNAQGFEVLPKHILLADPIRTLDNRLVELEFTEDVTAQVKVWVVREGGQSADEQESEEPGFLPEDEDEDAD